MKRSDVIAAKTAVGKLNSNTSKSAAEDMTLESLDESDEVLLERSDVDVVQTAVAVLNSDTSKSNAENTTLESLDELDGTVQDHFVF